MLLCLHFMVRWVWQMLLCLHFMVRCFGFFFMVNTIPNHSNNPLQVPYSISRKINCWYFLRGSLVSIPREMEERKKYFCCGHIRWASRLDNIIIIGVVQSSLNLDFLVAAANFNVRKTVARAITILFCCHVVGYNLVQKKNSWYPVLYYYIPTSFMLTQW